MIVQEDNVFVPNRMNARITTSKVTDYLLNDRHPQGSGKAKFFLAHGYRASDTKRFEEDLLNLVRTVPVTSTRSTPYGIHYVVEGRLTTPSGRLVQVVTVWLIEEGAHVPRLITAYPGTAI